MNWVGDQEGAGFCLEEAEEQRDPVMSFFSSPYGSNSFVVVSTQLMEGGRKEKPHVRFWALLFSFACMSHTDRVVNLFLTECLHEGTKPVSRLGSFEIRSKLIKGTKSNH